MTEPLSPWAVNRQSKQPPPAKIDTVNKDKNHAPPPPKVVAEPGGDLGVKYETGKLLGRGGFAICYEGTIVGHKYGKNLPKFALKIVKAKMGMKKMEEKVRLFQLVVDDTPYLICTIVSNGVANSLQNATSKYRRIPSSLHLRRQYLYRARTLP